MPTPYEYHAGSQLGEHTLPDERTYLPFLENVTEHTSAPSCAWRNVEIQRLETASQILMLPSTEPDTKCFPSLAHLNSGHAYLMACEFSTNQPCKRSMCRLYRHSQLLIVISLAFLTLKDKNDQNNLYASFDR